MTKFLKRRILLLAMACMGGILLLIIGGMNLINYRTVVEDLDGINRILLQLSAENSIAYDENGKKLSPNMIRRVRVESRYFKVILDEQGNVEAVRRRYNDDINDEQASAYAKKILALKKRVGFQGDYRYVCETKDSKTRVVCVYAREKLTDCFGFLKSSVAMGVIGYLVVFLVLWYGIRVIVEPIEQANQKQKRFITDAGHEIKTPLAIISVNTDILKMEYKDHECLDDISYQVKRLNNLTQNLLYLTHMEEGESRLEFGKVNLSKLVESAERTFGNLAKQNQKKLVCENKENISLRGNQEALEKLLDILLDNAVKYATVDSTISVGLETQGRMAVLSVANVAEHMDAQSVKEVFERFYRAERAQEPGKDGYGIGLSIAKTIVEAHRGKIEAKVPREKQFLMQVSLPL